MMTRVQWQRWCAWRAVEEGDPGGTLPGAELRVEATARTKGGMTAAAVDREVLAPEVVAFLERRVAWLEDLTGASAESRVKGVVGRLWLPQVPSGWGVGLVGLAAGVGFGMTQLGQERELNLLALPLVGVLLWNAVVMLMALVAEFWGLWDGTQRGAEPGGVTSFLLRRAGRPTEVGEEPREAEVQAAFRHLVQPTAWQLVERRIRVWLHVAAAVLALSSAVALFARGWSREYRVVWESSLLSDAGASAFFGGLFGPASAVLGVPIPLEEVPLMRRGQAAAASPGAALPWLQLYAGTLVLGIVLPRVVLAALTAAMTRRRLRRVIEGQGWGAYGRRLLLTVEGGDQAVQLVFHGRRVPEAVQERWLAALRLELGGMARFRVECVPEGEEDEWAAGWEPQMGRVVLVFYLASTPEMEVQRELARQVKAALERAHLDPRVEVVLDGHGLLQKWSEAKRSGRLDLWRETLHGQVERVRLLDEKGLAELRPGLS